MPAPSPTCRYPDSATPCSAVIGGIPISSLKSAAIRSSPAYARVSPISNIIVRSWSTLRGACHHHGSNRTQRSAARRNALREFANSSTLASTKSAFMAHHQPNSPLSSTPGVGSASNPSPESPKDSYAHAHRRARNAPNDSYRGPLSRRTGDLFLSVVLRANRDLAARGLSNGACACVAKGGFSRSRR
jgi:hypothetical protein